MDTLANSMTLITNRIKLWIAIAMEKYQAGAVEGRGCLEQISKLRLL